MTGKRLYQTIAKRIIELIDDGTFPVGSRLPGERDLAKKFAVSRVAVREAEIALQAQGRLEIKGGSGAYVKNTESQFTGLSHVSAFELTEARAVFEAEATALAASLITDDKIADLEHYLAIMSDEKADKSAVEAADEAFHRTIAQATNNPAIIYVVEILWQMRRDAIQSQAIYSAVCDDDHLSRKHEHTAVLDALKKRDPVRARKSMRAHFTRMIESLLVSSEEEAVQAARRQVSENRARFLLSKSKI